MRIVRSTRALVLSRVRFDWRRHAAALAAVAVLMASFLTFNAVAAGMDEGLREALIQGGHDRIQVTLGGFVSMTAMDEAAFHELSASPGVVQASPRSAKSVGLNAPVAQGGPGGGLASRLGNVSMEFLLVGIDAKAEADLVVSGSPERPTGPTFMRGGFQTRNYTLLEGSWIQGPGDAVVTQNAAAAGHGIGSIVSTSTANYSVVGIIGNQHAAALSAPGVIPAGHILVDRATQEWSTIGGAFFELEPDFAVIQAFAQRLIADYPGSTGGLQADVTELERQHFEEARTQQVLEAAGRLVAVAGAATVFAMSLFLLIGERKAIGTLVVIGFTRTRLASYMNQKMLLVALLGALGGGAIGWVAVALVPTPALSFDFAATLTAATYAVAAAQTLAAALAGSLLAFILTIRQDPIQALQVTE